MVWFRGKRRTGFVAIEVAAVVAVISLLLAMGFMLYRSMRMAAHVSVAESNLKQVSTGMELYFRKYSSYPPQGSDLVAELGPFVDDPEVFANPLLDEETPGETINKLYQQPTLEDLDSPGNYVTAMVSEDGNTAVILQTGDKVVRHNDLALNPDDPAETLLAALDPQPEDPDDGGDDADDDDDLPEGDPGETASPNDFTEEMPAGVVTAKGCYDADFEVVRAALAWGEDGPEIPIYVRAHFRHPNRYRHRHRYENEYRYESEDGSKVSLGLFGGAAVKAGDKETRTVREQESYTLTADAAYDRWWVSYASGSDTHQVATLRNGDIAREFSALDRGETIDLAEALAGLIDAATGSVTIGNNQVLYLFELGTTDRNSPHFDFQDLVMLVTLRDPVDPSACEDTDTGPTDDGFDIDEGGEVEVKVCSDVRILAVGSQFGYADGTLVDIVAAADMQQGWFPLFNGQPVKGGELFAQDSVPAGTRITLKGEIAGSYERWLWTHYGYPLSYTSNDGAGQVLTLKRGDTPIYFKPGFPCQAPVGELLAPHLDPQTGVVVIAESEALYLWDFNPLSTEYGIDFQDLIVLATAVAAERECEDSIYDLPTTEPARPILTFTPSEVTTDSTSFSFQVTNSATGGNDVATNVQINVQVTEGGNFVNEVTCNAALGEMAAGETKDVNVFVGTQPDWGSSPGQKIVLLVTVHNEDSWPEQNEGKSVTATINGPDALHPVLVLRTWTKERQNRGHGNNLDHDDEDNPGNGGGNHGADEGYDDDGYDDDEMKTGRSKDRQCMFEIANTAARPHNAEGVRVAATVTTGAQYVRSVTCSITNIGDIRAGTSKYFNIKMYPDWDAWRKAPNGTEVVVQIRVVDELNDPNANIGKVAEVTIVK